MVPAVASKKVSHWFGQNKVLFDITLDIQPGTIVSVVGPSGCGKSVWLKGVSGILPPRSGNFYVHIGNNEFIDIRKPNRHVGMVFQDKTVMPFLNAIENVAFGLKLAETSIPYRIFAPIAWRKLRKVHLEEAAKWLEKVGLKGSEYKYPHELSGGMQQRLAIAQAMITKPKILLMDEPFSALDEANREKQQRLLLALRADSENNGNKDGDPPFTCLIVTHEINEAIYVGNRVIGLSQYWNWKDEGHETCPGAKIVYDQPAPMFNPYDSVNYDHFVEQKTDILRTVFDKNDVKKSWKEKIEAAHVQENIVHTE
jgi:NitT/TauT family transport system ATP-binding protein